MSAFENVSIQYKKKKKTSKLLKDSIRKSILCSFSCLCCCHTTHQEEHSKNIYDGIEDFVIFARKDFFFHFYVFFSPLYLVPAKGSFIANECLFSFIIVLVVGVAVFPFIVPLMRRKCNFVEAMAVAVGSMEMI